MRRLLLPLVLASPLAACEREDVPVTEPKQRSETPFQYPEELWDAGVEGETTLRLYVNAAGSVDTARVERSSGYPAFDSAALAGSKELRFDPARRGEKPVGTWVVLPVQFNLPEGAAGVDSAALPPTGATDTAAGADTGAATAAPSDTSTSR